MGFLLLKSKLLTMKKVQYKIIHIKPNSPSQLTLGTTNYMWLLRFLVSNFGPYFIIYSWYLQRKTLKPFNMVCVWRGHEGDRPTTQGSSILGRLFPTEPRPSLPEVL